MFSYCQPRLQVSSPFGSAAHSFAAKYFQSLTNCLKIDTLSLPLCFQQVPTVKFCNPFALITIRIAGGGYGVVFRFSREKVFAREEKLHLTSFVSLSSALLGRNGALASPLQSIVSALFPIQWGEGHRISIFGFRVSSSVPSRGTREGSFTVCSEAGFCACRCRGFALRRRTLNRC